MSEKPVRLYVALQVQDEDGNWRDSWEFIGTCEEVDLKFERQNLWDPADYGLPLMAYVLPAPKDMTVTATARRVTDQTFIDHDTRSKSSEQEGVG